MELKFKGSFIRDLEKYNRSVLIEVWKATENIRRANSTSKIQHLKKLRKYKTLYRIKVKEEYRIGITIRNKTVQLVRFGHRSIFYKNFP